jgi:signal transduction histidine kinase
MAAPGAGQGPLDRIAAFRLVYLGIFAFVVLSVTTIEVSETLLGSYFRRAVDQAVDVSPVDGPIIGQIQKGLRTTLASPWIRLGGVRVNALVLGADGRTPIFLGGRTVPPPLQSPGSSFREASRLLPAITTVDVSVPLDSLLGSGIWVGYGLIFVPLLFRHQRAVVRREEHLITAAVAARDASAERARAIQDELDKVNGRLTQLEPTEKAQAQEIAKLERERAGLRNRMHELSSREQELRVQAAHSHELEGERTALEEMLEEAMGDLDTKQGEIQELNDKLKRASRGAGKAARSSELLARRLHTLYRNLEIDDRAIDDIVSLGDEAHRLRAEESLKRLDDDHETAGTRRKVGGLPAGLSIFELGFAGKGRIYYAKGRQRSFRILAVGGKASQKQDLEFLSRVSLD